MLKKLTYSKVSFVEITGALMLVDFLDDDGNMYQWAPKWSQVNAVFLKQVNVERFNKPESAFLNQFAKTVQDVVEGAQKITSGHKIKGSLRAYEDGKLVINTYDGRETACVPAFDVNVEFLDTWLSVTGAIEFFLVNNMVIRLTVWEQVDEDKNEFWEYPPKDKPTQE